MPVVDYYGKMNKVVRVDGDRNPVDVFVDLRKHFDKLDKSTNEKK
jgi:adenylate kinase family enzyme